MSTFKAPHPVCTCRHRTSIFGEKSKCLRCGNNSRTTLSAQTPDGITLPPVTPPQAKRSLLELKRIREIEKEIEEQAKIFEEEFLAKKRRGDVQTTPPNSPISPSGMFPPSVSSSSISLPPSSSSSSPILPSVILPTPILQNSPSSSSLIPPAGISSPLSLPSTPNKSVAQLSAQITEFEMILDQYKVRPGSTNLQNLTQSFTIPAHNSATTTSLPPPPPRQFPPLTVAPPLSSLLAGNSESEDDEDKQCVVCLERKKTHILIPCGHYAYCDTCAKTLKICALCRVKVTRRVKVFEA
ncbi:baculoviral IAP repeat-containing protein 7 [Folsomia candida]|uniref:E3 ubiquitin-protein ligase mind-bomb n=1 Tax=Folsomia candida TaxID=158441 RepID=A0A226DGN2_FOLCA|nr:baculoviral IAP repeat-containing protein 7 [Folsomia candida]OXA44310.1 E3 ubiquitin-protein ligase mind-bomb [Folsomia candida]